MTRQENLKQEIEHLDGLGVKVSWFVNAEGDEAVGIGDGFAWVVFADDTGFVSTQEAPLGEWSTGIEV